MMKIRGSDLLGAVITGTLFSCLSTAAFDGVKPTAAQRRGDKKLMLHLAKRRTRTSGRYEVRTKPR